MAQIKINGEIEEIEENITLKDFLSKRKLPKQFVAELNYDIINKEKYADVILKDGDKLELATFCGGG